MYPKYYISENDKLVLWRADVGGVEVGMSDSSFESSACSEEELKSAYGIKEITYDEAKSLFPDLIK